MSSQIVTTSPNKRPKAALPYAFTEHGVVMLSSVLRSETAIQVNIAVTRAFVAVRQMVTEFSLLKRLSALEKNFNELDVKPLTLYMELSLKNENKTWYSL